MALRVLAIIKNGKEDVGYRLYDENSGAVGDFKKHEALLQLKHYGCSNVKLEDEKLVGLECSIDRLTVLDTSLNVVKDGGLIVLDKLVNGRETVGYTLVNAKGEKLSLSRDEALIMMTKYGISNASRVTKDGKVYLRGIKKDIKTVDVKNVKTEQPKKQVKQLVAKLRLHTFVVEGDKTEYTPEAIAIVDNLTKEDIDKVILLHGKSKGIEVDMLSNSRIRVVSTMDMQNLVQCTQQVLNFLNGLNVELISLEWVTGVHFKADNEFEELLRLKSGEFKLVKTERYCEGGVTPLDNADICLKDVGQVLKIINNWGKCSNGLKETMSTDMYWLRTTRII